MERYELKSGEVYEIIRWADKCTVSNGGRIVYTGTYAGCRKYIESRR